MKNSMFSRCVYGFASEWPYLSYLGIGAWWAWVWVCYSSTVLAGSLAPGDQGSAITLMYVLSTPAIATLLLLAGVFWDRFTGIITKNVVIVVSGVIAGAATVVLVFGHTMAIPWLFVCMAILTGVCTGILCLKCGQVYGRLAARDSLMMGFMSLVFACFLYFVAIGLPSDLGVVFAGLLPIIAALLFIMPGDDPFPEATWRAHHASMRKGAGARSFRHLVVASALIAFTASMGQGMAAMMLSGPELSRIGVLSTLLIGVLALLFAVFVCGGDIVNAVRRIYSFLMLWGITVVVLSCFGLNLSFMGIGKEELWMLFSCLMAYMAFRFDFSPVQAFGIGQSVYFFASSLSWVFGSYIASTFENVSALTTGIGIVFAFVIVLVMSFVFTDSDIKFILTWRPIRAEEDQESQIDSVPLQNQRRHFEDSATRHASASSMHDAHGGVPLAHDDSESETSRQASSAVGEPSEPTLHDLVESIDDSYGLSDREREVLELFAQGRSANWIADDLSISKNTVRSHVRSIYTKLDVHTRQELISFLRN